MTLLFSRESLGTEIPDEIMEASTSAACRSADELHVSEIRLRRAVTVDDSVGYFAAEGERDRKQIERMEGSIA